MRTRQPQRGFYNLKTQNVKVKSTHLTAVQCFIKPPIVFQKHKPVTSHLLSLICRDAKIDVCCVSNKHELWGALNSYVNVFSYFSSSRRKRAGIIIVAWRTHHCSFIAILFVTARANSFLGRASVTTLRSLSKMLFGASVSEMTVLETITRPG